MYIYCVDSVEIKYDHVKYFLNKLHDIYTLYSHIELTTPPNMLALFL